MVTHFSVQSWYLQSVKPCEALVLPRYCQMNMKRNIRILSIAAVLFICMASIAFAAEDEATILLQPNGSDISISIKTITKDDVRHLFLPSGTTETNLKFPEGEDELPYEIMTDENIGSLHFFSDDPENMGMDYIHGSADHSTKAPGSIVLLDENGNVEYEGGVDAIKGRGNTTWERPDKKPYQIKLAKKANLLDLSDDTQKAKKWILLADAFDTTLIRNEIAYSLAKEMGLESTPEGKHVDFYYDGEYRGLYFLCEKVEIGKGRIEINDMDDHPEITTGGYLLEIDKMYYRKEPVYFIDKVAGPIVFKSPEEPTDEQMEYIQQLVGEAMQCIKNEGRSPDSEKTLFDYFDRDSLVRYFLVNEWMINTDVYMTSTYLYKPEDSDKLFMGPVWDCDYSMGKRTTREAYKTWYIPRLAKYLIKIPEFRNAVQYEYVNNMRPLIKDTLLGENNRTYLRTYSEMTDQISTAAIMNHTAWTLLEGGEGVKYWPIEIENLNKWLNYRAEWSDEAITDESFMGDTWDPYDQIASDDTTTNSSSDTSQPAASEVNDHFEPAKPKSLRIKAKKKSLDVSWAEVKKASGYQVRYYQENNKSIKYKVTKNKKINLKKLKRKTRYAVQVRTYRSINGDVYYSPWTTKTVKTK